MDGGARDAPGGSAVTELVVGLGDARYRVERPFGAWPKNAGFVTDVAVDPRGHVFVMLRHDPLTQPADPRVIELSPDGDYRAGWGGETIADSHYLTADDAGHLWAVDRDMHEVVQFTRDGARLRALGRRGRPLEPFNHPTDVHVSAWGDIYVSDGYAAAQVHRFDAEGRPLGAWGRYGAADGAFAWPHALWTFPDGRVVVVDRAHDRVQVFDREGRHRATWGDFVQPVGIWGDDRGRSYVTDMVPSLHLMAPDGTRLGRCRPVLNGAHGLSGTPDAAVLYLAESNPSRVTRLTRIG
jgi:sugar lactone lactonase YvrE